MAIKRRIAATHQVTAILYDKEDYKKDNFGTFVFFAVGTFSFGDYTKNGEILKDPVGKDSSKFSFSLSS